MLAYVLIFAVCLVAWLVRYMRRHYGVLESIGVPVIPPSIFGLGSGPILYHKYFFHELDEERFRKYGPIWAYYEGSTPIVSIADPEILKQIFVKDFDHFPSHFFQLEGEYYKKYRTIDIAFGQEWKDLRKGLSPTFSSGKIKAMLDPMHAVLDNLVKHLENCTEKSSLVDMRPIFQTMSMDAICQCTFGINVNSFEKNSSNELVDAAKKIFDGSRSTNFFMDIMFLLFFSIDGIEKYMPVFDVKAMDKLFYISKDIQTKREKMGPAGGDFMDCLVELKKKVVNGELPSLSEEQVSGQGIIFFAAGYETTANTLGSLCYNLVKNPEALENLNQEIETVLEEFDGRVDTETIQDMPYLDACIKETLRLNGPTIRNDRLCEKDWEFKGIKIKAGTQINIPNYVLHHNPEYFPEPEAYRPERFLKENSDKLVQFSFVPFGGGPRACIGERFAMVQMKITMVRLLQAFRMEMAEETRRQLYRGDIFLQSYSDMFIHLYKKN